MREDKARLRAHLEALNDVLVIIQETSDNSNADRSWKEFIDELMRPSGTLYHLQQQSGNVKNTPSDLPLWAIYPLHSAILKGSVEICKLLLDGGAKCDTVDPRYSSPMELANNRPDYCLNSKARKQIVRLVEWNRPMHANAILEDIAGLFIS